MNQLLSGKLGLLARVLVLALGSLAVLSYLIGQEGLRTYSIVSVTSPLPIVFSRYGSQENYGSVVTVRYVEQDGQAAEKQLKPDDFKIAGPYSRRAVYVGIFALGVEADKERPISEITTIMHRGVCGDGPLRKLLDISPDTVVLRIFIHPREETAREESFAIHCQTT